jgi:succinoglycan biosynthesis transport protein ExoP
MSRITEVMGRSSGDPQSPNSPWPIDDAAHLIDDGTARDWSRSGGDPSARGSVVRDGSVLPADNDLIRYGNVMRRRWRLGVAIAAVVVVGVTAGSALRKPTFRAAGLLEIRHESTAPVAALFSSDRVPANDLETQFGVLRSGSLAARVATHLSNEKGPGAPHVDAVTRGLRITPKTGSRLVEVSYASANPDTSVAVVNSVLDNYLQVRMEDAKRSADWLGRQLREARGRLEASEARLQTFLRTHSLDVVETGKGETAQLVNERTQTLHKALADAQADRIVRQSLAERAARDAGGDLQSPVLQGLHAKLADLRRDQARLSAVFHSDYPGVQAVLTQISETERLIGDETRRIATRIERDYEAARRREDLIRQAIAGQDALVQRLGRNEPGASSYEALKREVVTNQAQYAALDQRLKEVTISAALRAANVGIVDRAVLLPAPSGSSLPVVFALASTVGLLAGVGAMFLREHLDTSVRSVRDVGAYLGLPTLGAIPGIAARSARSSASDEVLAEAFAALRTAVLLRDEAAASRVLLVTSANPGEGKTTVSVNLASSLSRLHHRVLLVDANLRSPVVHQLFRMTPDPSLVDVLAGRKEWRECVRESAQPGLHLLTAGTSLVSPADLLSLPQMRQLIATATCDYDFVVIDAPAALRHPADVHALTRLAGRVLLTVRQGVTPRTEIQLALSQFDQVSGVVLNDFDTRESAAAGGLPLALA